MLKDDVITALKTVYDPEIPVNIHDLGLIYGVETDDKNNVTVTMTLTAPNCPIADDVVAQVYAAVADVPTVGAVKVNLVFEPEWTPDRMTDEARLMLNM